MKSEFSLPFFLQNLAAGSCSEQDISLSHTVIQSYIHTLYDLRISADNNLIPDNRPTTRRNSSIHAHLTRTVRSVHLTYRLFHSVNLNNKQYAH